MANFDKYQTRGAYHWRETDPSWGNAHYNPPVSARYEVLLRLLPAGTQTVLDVGCGDGYLLHRLCVEHPRTELVGVDNELEGVRLAQDQLQDADCSISVQQGSTYALPFDPARFDAVFMTDVIEHLEEPDRALEEVRRVLRPRGTLFLTTPNRQPDLRWDPEHHVHEYSPGELETLLSAHFASVELAACWPMRWMRRWRTGAAYRQAIRAVSRLGYNPLLSYTTAPSVDYGQLIARCTGEA